MSMKLVPQAIQVMNTFINKTAFVGDLWMSHSFKLRWKMQLQLQGNSFGSEDNSPARRNMPNRFNFLRLTIT